ncbi:MAG: DUF1801 domain-containing protein [Aquincola tertiaricarbonis]|uniref:DUF1801 domain-containing protein n=1 Tax=Aquincola TaxID=391952 RepID=UPI0006149CFA|nr:MULTISPECIES: DUF1801 domain-containing protein [Aquincola]MCR5865411.1 DUF1801 domain-containing protein [Aquincola sp. J276]
MRHLVRSAALIEAWFDMLPPQQQPSARALQTLVLRAAPSLGQAVKWGNLIFTVHHFHALAIAPYKSHVHLQVFRGAALVGRFPMLEGTGRGLRHLKWRYSQPLDEELIADLVHATVQLMQQQPGPTTADD